MRVVLSGDEGKSPVCRIVSTHVRRVLCVRTLSRVFLLRQSGEDVPGRFGAIQRAAFSRPDVPAYFHVHSLHAGCRGALQGPAREEGGRRVMILHNVVV